MKKADVTYIHDLLAKLDERLDSVDSKLHSIDKTTVLQQASLDEHIRRTNLLEAAVKKLDSDTQTSLGPIQKHVSTVQTIFTFVCKLVGGVAVLAAIWEVFRG